MCVQHCMCVQLILKLHLCVPHTHLRTHTNTWAHTQVHHVLRFLVKMRWDEVQAKMMLGFKLGFLSQTLNIHHC